MLSIRLWLPRRRTLPLQITDALHVYLDASSDLQGLTGWVEWHVPATIGEAEGLASRRGLYRCPFDKDVDEVSVGTDCAHRTNDIDASVIVLPDLGGEGLIGISGNLCIRMVCRNE
ncbi:MAG: hypothetical protein AAF570_03150 [Bacteroidota bacterium]